MKIFKSIEIGVRKNTLNKFIKSQQYSNLPLIKRYLKNRLEIQSDEIADLFSLIRAHLNVHSADVINQLKIHRNDVRFCRGLIIPNLLLMLVFPYCLNLFLKNAALYFTLTGLFIFSTIGIFLAYISRLKWMQEFTIRTYHAINPVYSPIPLGRIAFILVGPSGSGKSKLISALSNRCNELKIVAKCTTRDKRKGEAYCLDYRYISLFDFERLKKENKFINTKNSEFDESEYGILFEDIMENYKYDLLLSGHSLAGVVELSKDLKKVNVSNIIAIHIVVDIEYSLDKLSKSGLSQSDEARLKRIKRERELNEQLLKSDPEIIKYSVQNKDCEIFALSDLWEIIKFERSKANIGHCQDYNYEVVKHHFRNISQKIDI
ncbi:MAG: hypothetical protein JSU85_01425 [Candidatus Zixiibacteriota bacterium]|nr:MAG: hypothetical protein JSU85_01425 [candidate division Zixibacteria bacterium]